LKKPGVSPASDLKSGKARSIGRWGLGCKGAYRGKKGKERHQEKGETLCFGRNLVREGGGVGGTEGLPKHNLADIIAFKAGKQRRGKSPNKQFSKGCITCTLRSERRGQTERP